MELFRNKKSLIKRDGELFFYPEFLSAVEADRLFKKLYSEVNWQQYSIKIFGKTIPQPRLCAWYGEPGTDYSYSGLHLEPNAFLPELLRLKEWVSEFTKHEFNSVLLNLYRDQKDSMGWHSDDEKELGSDPFIASVSLGETRLFSVKHKQDKKLKGSLRLTHGSLLTMGNGMQNHWQHAVPKSTAVCKPRINLTFRKIER
ncbi:MAG: alpha-ketoglutarate-dependent dioxygenase AlkB [Bacteroidia bacterium]|nr:alpha-ketoglutarate-dependent dioxygenase AlkB [Bacteroidia bacterium]